MPVNIKDLIDLLAEICEKENIKVGLKETAKGAVTACVATGIGGLLLGPIGLAIGGALGGGLAAICAQGKFQPISVTLRNLKREEQEKLYKRLQHAFRNFGMTDVVTLSALIMSQASFQELAVKEVRNFLTNDLSYILHN